MRTLIVGALLVGAVVTLASQASAIPSKQRNGQISFWGDRDPIRPSIYAMNPDGTRVRDLGRGMHSAKRADWSPDGRFIAFDGRDYVTFFDFDIFVARADGSERRKVTRGPARDLMPAWSPAWAPARVLTPAHGERPAGDLDRRGRRHGRAATHARGHLPQVVAERTNDRVYRAHRARDDQRRRHRGAQARRF